MALDKRSLNYRVQESVDIYYEGTIVGTHRPDLIVDDTIVVELKAIKALEGVHFSQVRSYLKATQLKVGLLMNFNSPTLVVKRIVL